MWKAKADKILPQVVADYPSYHDRLITYIVETFRTPTSMREGYDVFINVN